LKKRIAAAAAGAALSLMLVVPQAFAADSDASGASRMYAYSGVPSGTSNYGMHNAGTDGMHRLISKAYAPGDRAYETMRTNNFRANANTAANDNNDWDWGWLGLLGLIGLAGLRGRSRERSR
jgi:MYXO-CTERM domain-containing protein